MGLVRYCGEEESEEEEARRREIMEWENRQKQQQVEEEELQVVAAVHNNGQVVPYVKVMTDDQMELLRKQIAAYATICDQLVHLHKSITSQQDLTGMKVGNFYCDSLMTSTGHKISSRQRWTPTAVQLQILEHIFDQGNGTPSKQKIKEITNELMQHGQISETNVYNWFQNRRARSKRKQLVTTTKNAEPEVEMEDEPQTENKAKSESIQPHENPAARPEDLGFSEMNGNLHYMESYSSKADSMFCSDSGSKSNSSLGHLSFYETVLSTPSIDQLMGKTEIPGSFNPFRPGEGYDMI